MSDGDRDGRLGRLTAVCVVARLLPAAGGPEGLTAIDKRPVATAVEVAQLGLHGDTQCDPRHHGGPEQAVYAYSDEDAAHWSAELGREVPPGLFGENLRVTGIPVSRAVVGEQWRIGGDQGPLLQVTAPRIPCATFQQRMQEPHWVKRFTEAGRFGVYLAVLEPGSLLAGQNVEVISRPGHGIRATDLFPAPSPETMARLLAADGQDGFVLSPKLRALAERHVGA